MMTDFLNKEYNWQTDGVVNNYDDLPIWSAIPGNLLLESIEYSTNKTIIDIGFGTGFPLLILAERFGKSCKVFGVDVWDAAITKTKAKIEQRNIENVTLLQGSATAIDLKDNSADIVTSNLGINNFDEANKVVAECYRLLKPEGNVYLTTNLVGTFKEFYDAFEATLKETKNTEGLVNLKQHIDARATVDGTQQLFTQHGFKASSIIEKNYTMNYADGTAFLNDYFIVMAFLPSWKALIADSEHEIVFSTIEKKLNQKAKQQGGLRLTVPYAVLKFTK